MTRTNVLPTLALLVPFFAHASQILHCKFPEGQSGDRVRVTLLDSNNGTFLYETADPAGAGSTEALKLKRAQDPEQGVAAFEIQSSAVQMTFKINTALLFQSGSGITASLLSRIPEMDLSQEQPLTCDSFVK
ncbi:MAG: hypothetical protein KGP28_07355 [Bdellovibrionales bacterium]|nr:hypothetical protein [Bdellovibrionales bacterium]